MQSGRLESAEHNLIQGIEPLLRVSWLAKFIYTPLDSMAGDTKCREAAAYEGSNV